MESEINKRIIELNNNGVSIREIASVLNIDRNKVYRMLRSETDKSETKQSETTISETDETTKSETDNKIIDNCPHSKIGDKHECSLYQEVNRIGVHKLRICDFTKEEIRVNPNAPYYNC